jgi:hypothetical protein
VIFSVSIITGLKAIDKTVTAGNETRGHCIAISSGTRVACLYRAHSRAPISIIEISIVTILWIHLIAVSTDVILNRSSFEDALWLYDISPRQNAEKQAHNGKE